MFRIVIKWFIFWVIIVSGLTWAFLVLFRQTDLYQSTPIISWLLFLFVQLVISVVSYAAWEDDKEDYDEAKKRQAKNDTAQKPTGQQSKENVANTAQPAPQAESESKDEAKTETDEEVRSRMRDSSRTELCLLISKLHQKLSVLALTEQEQDEEYVLRTLLSAIVETLETATFDEIVLAVPKIAPWLEPMFKRVEEIIQSKK